MDASRVLREARSAAGLTQRQLAGRVGIAQPGIARIEQGRVTPGVDTLSRLLAACGHVLEATARRGQGIDRTVIRRLLRLTPLQRLELAVAEATNLERLLETIER